MDLSHFHRFAMTPFNPATDAGLALFDSLLRSWSASARAEAQRMSEQSSDSGLARRRVVWDAIALARASDEQADWDMAMSLLAQAALANPRPIMVAATVLRTLFSQDAQIPFSSLALLVGPILQELAHDELLASPRQKASNDFPIADSGRAWVFAVRAASLVEPTTREA
jgi:hypothetical protein